MKHDQQGSALPLVLLLLTLLTTVTVSVMQNAIANTRLIGSIAAARQAFNLASNGTASGLLYITSNPATLPAADTVYTFPDRDLAVNTDLRPVSGPSGCNDLAPLNGTRHDFEIRATGRAGRGAISHHRQGFYICREDCGSLSCTGVETAPKTTYWYVTRQDRP